EWCGHTHPGDNEDSDGEGLGDMTAGGPKAARSPSSWEARWVQQPDPVIWLLSSGPKVAKQVFQVAAELLQRREHFVPSSVQDGCVHKPGSTCDGSLTRRAYPSCVPKRDPEHFREESHPLSG
ncbi:PREDICTED: LOW QUALITY PROTEIN: putative uncharacterized protein UNQ6494/PRO21346, partial [Cercocebus atys]|uniref:LOW QUALITY PROTEIN: putative uncharacterized protein UNQ6494/PRO21346 n=1 Tax=Cercocebus atys TaxID=9531 RepID=UPI0005F55C54